MFPDDRVGAGRIDDVNVAEDLGRRRNHVKVVVLDVPSGGLAVLKDVDLRRRRRHAFLRDRAADEGIDERALAGVELADDDEKKQLVELADRFREGGLVIGRGVELHERQLEPGENLPLFLEQFVLCGVEDLRQHDLENTRKTGARRRRSARATRISAER